jgi:ketosteroid isomerase-like protein
MKTENSKATEEAVIRKLIEDRTRAIRAKDINLLMSNHAPDIVSFDVVDPLRYTGVHIMRERAEKWFAFYETAIGCEVGDLNIATGGDVAFCHYIYRVTGTRTDGVKVDMWVRTTVCLRKTGDTWLIVREHQSVPFNPEVAKHRLISSPNTSNTKVRSDLFASFSSW